MYTKAIVWSKDKCPQCEQAKNILALNNINFEERKIGTSWGREDLLAIVPNARSVPQIFIDDQYVGGLNDLKTKLNKEGVH